MNRFSYLELELQKEEEVKDVRDGLRILLLGLLILIL